MDQELIEMRDEEVASDGPDVRPAIAPDGDGGICMEWMRNDKIMRVVIRGSGLNSYIYTREANKESQLHPLQKTKCIESLAWLTKV